MEEGFLVLNDVLPTALWQEVCRAFNDSGDIEEDVAGTLSRTNQSLLRKNTKLRCVLEYFCSPAFTDIISELTGYSCQDIRSSIEDTLFLQTLNVKYNAGGRAPSDEQNVFHSDTFQPAFKLWYFPESVGSDDIPFEYVPGSHLPHGSLLRHFFDSYLDNAYQHGQSVSEGNIEGSIRISESKLLSLGLASRKIFCKLNSLVIANVTGFHRRSIVFKDSSRHALHASIRPSSIFIPETYREFG